MGKGVVVILTVIFVLLLIGVTQGLAGPKGCPDDQICETRHKITPSGCREAEFPVQSQSNGWSLGLCPAPAPPPAQLMPTNPPANNPPPPPPPPPPPANNSAPAGNTGGSSGANTASEPAAVYDPAPVCIESCPDPGCCPLDESEQALNYAEATRAVAEAGWWDAAVESILNGEFPTLFP